MSEQVKPMCKICPLTCKKFIVDAMAVLKRAAKAGIITRKAWK